MDFITYDDVLKIRKQSSWSDRYYKNRWDYLKEIIDQVKKLDDVERILEMGPFKSPIVVGEDIIDITDVNVKYYPIDTGKFIKHDCSKTPYPIEDKEYDLVISSQVLEHLGLKGEQKDIFNEIKRISRKAIISLPYMWFAPNERDHHMIDERMINKWTNNYKPIFEQINGTRNSKRIMLVYEFD